MAEVPPFSLWAFWNLLCPPNVFLRGARQRWRYKCSSHFEAASLWGQQSQLIENTIEFKFFLWKRMPSAGFEPRTSRLPSQCDDAINESFYEVSLQTIEVVKKVKCFSGRIRHWNWWAVLAEDVLLWRYCYWCNLVTSWLLMEHTFSVICNGWRHNLILSHKVKNNTYSTLDCPTRH